ncbi:Golgi integral membrane protein 4-like isoform X2 [Chelonus insularis]|nr:Golgi integral membrane protein 4-like isoform X2 [Chelonus insularis]XP_034943953.1 Golgi integral membrane protein 4-like isoform X2 [Chelonus insularis]
MNGTRLGRGRGGRLAVYGGCGIVVILLVFLYRTATTEMTRLRDLNIQCSNQQEALAAQLQVIFEYKVRLEKSLAEEKNSNAAAKRELQERANREKSLRDKDSLEALSRYKSLQQQHKLLQSEIQDLRDECDKEQKRALEEANKLESTLQDLRSKLRKEEEKDKNLEHLKNKYIELEIDKKKVDEKYSELLKNTGNTDNTVEHLRKEVFQLQRELEESKLSCKGKDISVNFADLKSKEPAAELSLKKPSGNSIPAVSSSQQPQQNNSLSTVAKMSIGNSTKSSMNSSSTTSDKLPNVVVPMKSVSRGKLPEGVPPIPKLVDPKLDKEELKITNPDRISPVDDGKNKQGKNIEKQKVFGNIGHEGIKHVADQILGGQENPLSYRVKPGVQEIGDEPNNLKKQVEFEEAINAGNADQYDYYNKDIPQKNSEINLDEGEEGEEEGDEGDDPLEYQNNGVDKNE